MSGDRPDRQWDLARPHIPYDAQEELRRREQAAGIPQRPPGNGGGFASVLGWIGAAVGALLLFGIGDAVLAHLGVFGDSPTLVSQPAAPAPEPVAQAGQPAAAPAAQGVPPTDVTLPWAGTWVGNLTEQGVTYPVTFVLKQTGTGYMRSVSGTVTYPSLHCSGTIRQAGGTEEQSVLVEEITSDPAKTCTPVTSWLVGVGGNQLGGGGTSDGAAGPLQITLTRVKA